MWNKNYFIHLSKYWMYRHLNNIIFKSPVNLVILLLFVNTLQAKNIDSLKNEIRLNQGNDKRLVNLYYRIAKEAFFLNEFDTSYHYYQLTIQTAEKTDDYAFLAESKRMISTFHKLLK